MMLCMHDFVVNCIILKRYTFEAEFLFFVRIQENDD